MVGIDFSCVQQCLFEILVCSRSLVTCHYSLCGSKTALAKS